MCCGRKKSCVAARIQQVRIMDLKYGIIQIIPYLCNFSHKMLCYSMFYESRDPQAPGQDGYVWKRMKYFAKIAKHTCMFRYIVCSSNMLSNAFPVFYW